MCVDVESPLVDAGRESRVKTLRETLRNREFVRDLGVLRRCLEGLRAAGCSEYSADPGESLRGRTLRSLARNVMKSAHSFTWSNDWSVFSTAAEYLRYFGSAWSAASARKRVSPSLFPRKRTQVGVVVSDCDNEGVSGTHPCRCQSVLPTRPLPILPTLFLSVAVEQRVRAKARLWETRWQREWVGLVLAPVLQAVASH